MGRDAAKSITLRETRRAAGSSGPLRDLYTSTIKENRLVREDSTGGSHGPGYFSNLDDLRSIPENSKVFDLTYPDVDPLRVPSPM